MSITERHQDVFKKGSKTYFNSSVFFPKTVRNDIFILYGFVRVADNFVDSVPQKREEFYNFCDTYRNTLSGKTAHDVIIDSFVDLIKRKGLKSQWVDAFLAAMEADLTKSDYNSINETIDYMYGSAEVIGLFMAKILDLPEESYSAAQMLGRSMQYINFIRDINEDLEFGRRYLPLNGFELNTLKKEEVLNKIPEFKRFIYAQLDQYLEWQKQAEAGFRYIPKRYRIPIKTASDMYNWTARQIRKNPMIVYEKKVKPSKFRIIMKVIGNAIFG